MDSVIPKNESETVEFKQSLSDFSSILEAICSFANKKGGDVFVGVCDDGSFCGVSIGKNTFENFSKLIKESISPQIFPSIETITIADKQIVKISVVEGEQKPYFCRGRAYIRLGKSNLILSAHEIEAAIKKRLISDMIFEDNKTEISTKETDSDALRFFYSKPRKGVLPIKKSMLFRNLGLEKENKFTVGGYLCFGKYPQSFFPQFSFRCGLLKSGQLVSIELMEGNIFQIIEKTFDYASSKIGNHFEIIGTKREVIYQYPLEAIREAIINSLIHRDLKFPSSNYLVISEDYLEIKNPGILPLGLSISKLKEEHLSIQRNKKMAHVLYLSDYIEHWGTGTTKMTNLCRSSGLTDPIFSEEEGFFKVRFTKKPVFANERFSQGLDLIKSLGQIRSSEYAKKFGITQRMARNDLTNLESQGFLFRYRFGREIIYSTNRGN